MNLRLFTLVTLVAAASACASPAWKSDLSSPVLGSHPRLAPTSLDYQISWKGILDSGRLRIEFAPPGEKKPGAYVAKAYGRSHGAAAKIHPYQFNTWSELHPAPLIPRFSRNSETDKNGTEVTTMRYGSQRVETDTWAKSISGKIENKHRVFEQSFVHDIFSAMLHIRSQPLASGDRINLVIQASDQPYLLRIRCLGRERHNGLATIKLSAGMSKIDRQTLALQPYKKLKRDATLWLSDDDDRIPVEVRAAIFVGDVRAVLIQSKKL